MKKLFFAICFIFTFFVTAANADVRSIADVGMMKHNPDFKTEQEVIAVESLPNPNNENEVREFFKKRFEEAAQSEMPEGENPNDASSIGIIYSPEYYAAQEEAKKSTFQKIYEEALAALNAKDKTKDENKGVTAPDGTPAEADKAAQIATRFFTLAKQQNTEQAEEQIPTVRITLPSGRKFLAPTDEHIPYLLSYINVQPNGFLKVEDTIVVVANGKKFAQGLMRFFPKYSTETSGKRHQIEIILEEVEINGTKVPYIEEEIGNNLIWKPKYSQKFEPGVYTYKFTYIVDNKLINLNRKVLLDWNITGSPINAFITSANAIIALPFGHSFSNWQTVIGNQNQYSANRANMFLLDKNVLAVSSTTPILNRESMNIGVIMDKNLFLKNYDKTFSHFMTDWGKIIYAGIGLSAILISYLLSLFTLNRDKKNNRFKPSYDGALMRNIMVGKYDRVAFIAQLLTLCRKKVFDMAEEDNHIYFLKGAPSSKLQKYEKKALNTLFARKSNRTEVSVVNNLRIKKAFNILKKQNEKQINRYKVMHNIMYVAFSTAMLIATEIFIAYISVNFAQSIIILASTSLLAAFYIWIIRRKFKRRIIGLLIKSLCVFALAGLWLFCSIYVGALTSLILIIMVAVIFAFSKIFAEFNNFVYDAKNIIDNYKDYLISSADAINLSRDFSNQQANIFALDIAEHFPKNVSNQGVYRLDIADNLKRSLIEIL